LHRKTAVLLTEYSRSSYHIYASYILEPSGSAPFAQYIDFGEGDAVIRRYCDYSQCHLVYVAYI